MQELLDAGADRNAKMRGGFTALTLASLRAHHAVVEALLDADADVGEVDLDAQDGRTALIYAKRGHTAQKRCTAIVQALEARLQVEAKQGTKRKHEEE